MPHLMVPTRFTRLSVVQLLGGMAGSGYGGALVVQSLLNMAVLGRPLAAHSSSLWKQLALGVAWPISWVIVAAGFLLLPDTFRMGLRWVLGFLVSYLGYALLAQDASAGGQFVLLLPVLIASHIARPLQAWLTCALACAVSAIVSLAVLSADLAILSVIVVVSTCVITTATVLDLTARHARTEASLRELAEKDHLTGLFTRRVLDRRVSDCVAKRQDGLGTALLLLDLDHFKVVNDTYGHPVGDALLQHIASALRQVTRPSDVACRLGGDELAILIPDVTHQEARAVAERACAAVRESRCVLPGGLVIIPQISAGLGYLAPERREGGPDASELSCIERLYTLADSRLYHAKRHRRGELVGT